MVCFFGRTPTTSYERLVVLSHQLLCPPRPLSGGCVPVVWYQCNLITPYEAFLKYVGHLFINLVLLVFVTLAIVHVCKDWCFMLTEPLKERQGTPIEHRAEEVETVQTAQHPAQGTFPGSFNQYPDAYAPQAFSNRDADEGLGDEFETAKFYLNTPGFFPGGYHFHTHPVEEFDDDHDMMATSDNADDFHLESSRNCRPENTWGDEPMSE